MLRFQKFQLKSYIGRGSFGVVWKASDGDKEFALKVILIDPENEEKQKRELDISSEASHKNLVKVNKLIKINARRTDLKTLLPDTDNNCLSFIFALRRKVTHLPVFCIMLELCGENLRNWLQAVKGDVDMEANKLTQIKIIRDVSAGLDFLHEKRIIHRDLKPENIMFSKQRYKLPVKIGDFGTCRVIADPQISTLTSSVGTELYRAPKAFSNEYSFQSDLFSLGLITWEVLQLLPFENLRSYFDKLVNGKKEEVVELCEGFKDFRELVIKLTKWEQLEQDQLKGNKFFFWLNNLSQIPKNLLP